MMKRLIAVMCAVAMLLSFTVGASAAELDFLGKKYYSYDGTVEFYVELNKPLDCVATLNDLVFENEHASFDAQYFVENLLKTKITSRVQAEVSEDLRVGKMYMSLNSNMPVYISEDLKFGADVTGHMWIDYDFTSAENAKMNIIFKNPLNGKFYYLDYFEPALYGVMDVTMIKQIMVDSFAEVDIDGAEEVTEVMKNVYAENATVTTDAEGYTKLSFTNNAFIDTVYGLIVGVLNTEYMANALAADGIYLSEEEYNNADVAMMVTFIKGLGIFSDTDAYTYRVKTDNNGYVTECEERIHVDFNIYEVAMALGADAESLTPLTKENSNVDVTFCADASYTKINEKNIVDMPVLTEENSYSFFALLTEDYFEDYDYSEDGYYEAVYQPEEFWNYSQGLMDRGGMYIDIEKFFNSTHFDEDNLSGYATLGEDGSVTIIFESDTFGSVTVKGNVNEDAYTLNDMQLWGRKPFKVVDVYNWSTYEADQKLYVNMDVLNYILGAKVCTVTTYLIDENGISLANPEYYFEIVRPNFAYVPVKQ